MTTFSANSRLGMMNLKDRRSQNFSQQNAPLSSNLTNTNNNEQEGGLKLTLIEPNTTYQPTNPFTSSRTQMRMLKGKIERSTEKQPLSNYFAMVDLEETGSAFTKAGLTTTEMNHTFKPKPEDKKMQLNNNAFGQSELEYKPMLNRPPLPQSGLKLVLPDEQPIKQQRKPFMINPLAEPKQQPSRRILIADGGRTESRDKKILIQPPPPPPPEKKQPQPIVQPPPISKPTEQPVIPPKQIQPVEVIGKPDQEEQIENQNELVECPEGCGRKFNRNALEVHAKACKIVFMSKRKEFNSQAKRVTNKQQVDEQFIQATLVKQAKQKEKKQLMGTGKFQKTGEAWKTQSEGFRAVVKALKQQQVKVEEEQVKVVICQFCEKKFNEILYSKHLPICEVKKDKERKLVKKGSKKM